MAFIYTLKDGIDFNTINWFKMSMNECDGALDLLELYPENIDWKMICFNTNDRAATLILNNLDKVNNKYIYQNSNYKIVKMLNKKILENDPYIDYYSLSFNTSEYFKLDDTSKLDYRKLSRNTSNFAVDLLLKNPSKIIFKELCYNSNDRAVELLLNNIHKLCREDLYRLCYNENDKIVNYLLQNPQYIELDIFSSNTNQRAFEYTIDKLHNPFTTDIIFNGLLYNMNENAVDLLLSYGKRVNYSNPGIFSSRYDYESIKSKTNLFEEELMEKVWHPNRYNRWPEDPFKD
jgi:hypothetical protein